MTVLKSIFAVFGPVRQSRASAMNHEVEVPVNRGARFCYIFRSDSLNFNLNPAVGAAKFLYRAESC